MPRSSAPPGARRSPPSAPAACRTPRSGSTSDATFGDFRIEAVPAYHEGAPEAVGYVVRNGAYVLYHAGDTRRVQGMAEAVQPHGVDVAFVPISGKHGNMDGTDAARLAYEAGAIDRDPLPLRDVPLRHRQHARASSPSASGSARSTASRAPASASRSTTASSATAAALSGRSSRCPSRPASR